MTFRATLPYLISTIFIVICSSYFLSQNTPFTGDEFFTLDIEKIHKPMPYRAVVSEIIEAFRPITPENIFSLRFSSILFTLVSIILWYMYFIRDKYEAMIFSILIITSSFLLQETIFFRYYSYYFLTSTVTFLFLIRWIDQFTINQKLIFSFIGIVFSPYIFFILNTLQYVFYFLFVLLFDKIKDMRYRVILTSFLAILFIYVLFNPLLIWEILNWINMGRHGNIDIASLEIRGFTLSILIKPFYAFFQMLFGNNVAPSESFLIILLFIIISLFIVNLFYKILCQDKKHFIKYLSIGLIPFLLIYFFLEAISLPGFTQLETKHGMLLYPIILALVVRAPKYLSPLISYLFIGVVLISQLIGMQSTYTKNNTDWNLVVDKVDKYLKNENSQKILMDGRSRETFNFYNQNIEIKKMISYTWEPMDSLEAQIKGKERLVLLLNDYKSYTPLTLEQNWNAGSGSLDRVEKLNMILSRVNKDYYLDDSYVSYPTYLYLLKKKVNRPDNIISAGVWQHHLKDLELPIKSDRKNDILSSIVIQPGDSVAIISDSILVFNLENFSKEIEIGDTVGIVELNSVQIPLILGKNIWDIFAEFRNDEINKVNVFHSWIHKPLVSGSIKYDGSYFHHTANLYTMNTHYSPEVIKVINNSGKSNIRFWISN
tara:strand:+ start:193 stop:2163 length:1971 start_codon:yes stop_codon:yes gene_type:complete